MQRIEMRPEEVDTTIANMDRELVDQQTTILDVLGVDLANFAQPGAEEALTMSRQSWLGGELVDGC
jgi:hypothetical protein